MKTAIIYYSLEGNTDYIAKEIAAITGGDLYRLEPEKEYPSGGFKKYFWGGKSVVFNEKPSLKNFHIDLSQYTNIVIGTPIWASSFAPPILTFLSDYKLSSKNLFLFSCSSGGTSEKCFSKIAAMAEGSIVVKTQTFLDPYKVPKTDTKKKIQEFCDVIHS